MPVKFAALEPVIEKQFDELDQEDKEYFLRVSFMILKLDYLQLLQLQRLIYTNKTDSLSN